jgi:hypothetical protein
MTGSVYLSKNGSIYLSGKEFQGVAGSRGHLVNFNTATYHLAADQQLQG